eukprot:gene564-8074_t
MFSDIFPLLLIVLIGFLVHYQQQPNVKNYQGSVFNETRAHQNLLEFSKNIGPRVVGTIQEEEASKFIIKKLKSLEICLKKISKPKIFEKLHTGANSIQIGTRPPVVVSYSNITNIIMYLEPLEERFSDAFMVSSHYDSGITSPGFYDDGVPVVVTLEVLQNLCDKKVKIKHPLIFLFNAAEEMGLLGASAFMKDEISKEIGAFINLEAAGTGGRNFIFQAGNSWIMNEFSKSVKNFKGNVMGQDVFELKIIPSDTDYKLYKLKDNCVGIDTAFYQNGHVYHTKGDSFETFEEGSILHMGENVEMFVEHMSMMSSNYNTKVDKDKLPVFFDFLSLKLITYSMEDSTNLNMIIFFIILFFIIKKCSEGDMWFNVTKSIISIGISLLTCILFSLVVAFVVLNITKSPMFWYATGSKFCLLFYLIPTIAGFFFSLRLFRIFSFDEVYVSVLVFWNILLLLMTQAQIGTSFIALLFSMSLFIGLIIKNPPPFLIIILPSIVLIDSVYILVEVFSAIMGRSYSTKADYVISVMVSAVSFLLLTLLIPFFYKMKNSNGMGRFFVLLTILFLTSSIFISPYNNERPKRIMIQQIVEFENETSFESFVAFQSTDAVSMDFIPLMHGFEEKNLTVFPIPTLGPPSSKATGVFKSIPANNDKSLINLKSKLVPKYTGKRVDNNTILISLESDVNLLALHIELETNCSFSNCSIPVGISEDLKGESFLYKFRHIYGYHDLHQISKKFEFTLEQNECKSNSSEIHLKIASIFIHESMITETLKYSLGLMPEWTSSSAVLVGVSNRNI